MKWKRVSNLILACILSITFSIDTLRNIIGPLHINKTGAINSLGYLSLASILYWASVLIITWCVYFWLRKKPELLFFTLIILSIGFIITENFLWGFVGS